MAGSQSHLVLLGLAEPDVLLGELGHELLVLALQTGDGLLVLLHGPLRRLEVRLAVALCRSRGRESGRVSDEEFGRMRDSRGGRSRRTRRGSRGFDARGTHREAHISSAGPRAPPRGSSCPSVHSPPGLRLPMGRRFQTGVKSGSARGRMRARPRLRRVRSSAREGFRRGFVRVASPPSATERRSARGGNAVRLRPGRDTRGVGQRVSRERSRLNLVRKRKNVCAPVCLGIGRERLENRGFGDERGFKRRLQVCRRYFPFPRRPPAREAHRSRTHTRRSRRRSRPSTPPARVLGPDSTLDVSNDARGSRRFEKVSARIRSRRALGGSRLIFSSFSRR